MIVNWRRALGTHMLRMLSVAAWQGAQVRRLLSSPYACSILLLWFSSWLRAAQTPTTRGGSGIDPPKCHTWADLLSSRRHNNCLLPVGLAQFSGCGACCSGAVNCKQATVRNVQAMLWCEERPMAPAGLKQWDSVDNLIRETQGIIEKGNIGVIEGTCWMICLLSQNPPMSPPPPTIEHLL